MTIGMTIDMTLSVTVTVTVPSHLYTGSGQKSTGSGSATLVGARRDCIVLTFNPGHNLTFVTFDQCCGSGSKLDPY